VQGNKIALNWKRASEQKCNLLMKNQRGRQSSCHDNRGPPAPRVNVASACVTSRTFSSPLIQRIVLSRIALKSQLRLTLLKKKLMNISGADKRATRVWLFVLIIIYCRVVMQHYTNKKWQLGNVENLDNHDNRPIMWIVQLYYRWTIYTDRMINIMNAYYIALY